MITIGSAKINTNVFLAPLSGCSDLAFRLIAREHGAKFAFYEMIDSNSLHYGTGEKSYAMLKTVAKDTPIAAQIIGHNPAIMSEAAIKVTDHVKVSFLDINAACPVKKMMRKKSGACLLTAPAQLAKIVEAVVRAVKVPVTVKLRIGYQRIDPKSIVKTAKLCVESGASALFVHGRTRAQGYAGEIDYGSIRAIKEAVEVPVFGSGNIFSVERAKMMFDKTGCDGILVARGAFGNPWIFGEIDAYLKKQPLPKPPSMGERIAVLKKHLRYFDRHFAAGPGSKIGIMRKVAIWYMKGFADAAHMRGQISIVKDYAMMLKLIDSMTKKGHK